MGIETDRLQSRPEEIANAVSHGVGLLLALIASPFLIVAATKEGGAAVVGASVFGASLVTLYFLSTLYHALPHGPRKRLVRILDHGAIFLLIAGTYTPFTLGVLRGPWGWTLFGLIWTICLAGVAIKILGGGVHRPRISLALYLGAGWLVVIAARPLFALIPPVGLLWLLAGGLAYTGGVALYRAKHVRYAHLGWHLCVLAGSTCHFVAVARYA